MKCRDSRLPDYSCAGIRTNGYLELGIFQGYHVPALQTASKTKSSKLGSRYHTQQLINGFCKIGRFKGASDLSQQPTLVDKFHFLTSIRRTCLPCATEYQREDRAKSDVLHVCLHARNAAATTHAPFNRVALAHWR
jgi:hypothetical protein